MWRHSLGGYRLNQNGGHKFYHVYKSFGFHSRMLVQNMDLSAVECKNDA